ncbi:MAG TPA: hypothetical protein VMD51_04080 [Mycobacterium sp.]|nr:hypothetical protein [Mycobacterium sp.]
MARANNMPIPLAQAVTDAPAPLTPATAMEHRADTPPTGSTLTAWWPVIHSRRGGGESGTR